MPPWHHAARSPEERVFEEWWKLSKPNSAGASSLPTAGAPPGALWPQADRPITSADQDMLRRGSFVSRVARVIDEVRLMEDSSVLAIVGPWGSGKSSLINLAVAELGSGWKIVRANTWAPPDVAGVIAELFAAIRSALPSDGRGRRAAKVLGEWAPLVTPGLSLIPVVGGSIKEVASSVSSHIAKRHDQRSMEQVFDDLSEKLKGLGLRILVVLDDVDRLQPDELLTLFKAIRLVASFPGVYYLLAYDEQTVIDVLTSTAIAAGNRERALAYLEKIVQVPLAMPPAEPHYAEKMVTNGLDDVLRRLGTPLADEQASRFRSLYDTLLRHTLSQPRAVGRFLRQAAAYLPMVDSGELDVVDFLALTHLRSFAPATYRLISNSKQLLTTPATAVSESSRGEFLEQVRKLLGQECGDASKYAWNALRLLFPEMDSALAADPAGQLQADRRVAAAEYFDRYFLLGVPLNDIADSTARDALRAIALDELTPARTTAETMIAGGDAAVADAVIRKLARFTRDDQVDASILQTVTRYAVSIPERTPEESLTGAAEAWAVAALVRMSQAKLSPAELAVGLTDQALRLLCTSLDRAMTDTRSPAIRVTADHVAQEAGRRIRSHLYQRDQADPWFPIVPLAQFIARSSTRDDFAGQLSTDLTSGEFTVTDLAARFVQIGTPPDGKAEILGLDDETLVAILGVARLAELFPESTSPDDAIPSIDKMDTTWLGRGTAGLAMLPDALQKRQAMPPRPPAGVRNAAQPSPVQRIGPRHWAIPRSLERLASDAPGGVLCIRAAILLPGSAQGLPGSLGSADISEEQRARILTMILGQMPLTKWCSEAAEWHGIQLQTVWKETGNTTRLFTGFSLDPIDGPRPLDAHCAITTGAPSPTASDVLALSIDLVLTFPFPPQTKPDGTPVFPLGDRLDIDHLARLVRMVADSAIQIAQQAATSLLNVTPEDGHSAVWLAASNSLDKVINLDQFDQVGNQAAPSEAEIFATLPLEPSHPKGSPEASDDLRGLATELIHELLRVSGRRGYAQALHSLRTSQ
jgi:hypothetical protein